ncbi:hypothetical protein Ocin01_18990 [Orchesella cincta]|uniref:Uncharacterized protein n=1 Tax=Orchesella cincta TaxID=48709 RepID=A0A1D2M450_ORCCI|nr:hypothetical protein Ocin01_18990 [Orchesella cincta]
MWTSRLLISMSFIVIVITISYNMVVAETNVSERIERHSNRNHPRLSAQVYICCPMGQTVIDPIQEDHVLLAQLSLRIHRTQVLEFANVDVVGTAVK